MRAIVQYIQKTHEDSGWKLQRAFVRTGAPHGGGHGDEIVVPKGVGIAFALQVLANGLTRRGAGRKFIRGFAILDKIQRELVKSNDIKEEAPHARREYVATLAE